MPQLTVKFLLRFVAHATGVEQDQMGAVKLLGQLVVGLLEQTGNAFRVVFVHLATVRHDRQLLSWHICYSLVSLPQGTRPAGVKRSVDLRASRRVQPRADRVRQPAPVAVPRARTLRLPNGPAASSSLAGQRP